MSQKSNIPLSNPILNDFVYTILYQSTYQEKRGLRGRYLRASMGAKAAKAFVQNSTLEEKLIVLNHFGLKWFMVFVKENTFNLEELKGLLKRYEENPKHPKALKDISDAKLFVTSDKQMEHLTGLVCQSLSHPSFFPNMEFSRVGYHLAKWPKKNMNEKDMQMRGIMEDANVICRTMLNAAIIEKLSMSYFGIAADQLYLLEHFYLYQHTYLSKDEAYAKFAGIMKKTKFTFHIKRCIEFQLIQKHAKDNFKYTITAKGINKVNSFFDTLLKPGGL